LSSAKLIRFLEIVDNSALDFLRALCGWRSRRDHNEVGQYAAHDSREIARAPTLATVCAAQPSLC
jgi:hypothetical protein